MFRKVIALLTALSLFWGSLVATPAFAAASTATCTAEKSFEWKHLGGAPFARSEAEAMKKLPRALADMVKAGCLPEAAVPGVLKLIHDNPQGTEVGGKHQLITLSNGMKLSFMESATHYVTNVVVGLVNVSRGLVAGVQAKIWAFSYNGVGYYVYMPLICFNWSLAYQGTPAPQVAAKPECSLIRSQFTPGTDRANHFAFAGPGAVTVDGPCWAWHYEGEAKWHSYRECPDDACTYASFEQATGMKVHFKGRTDLAPPPGVRWVEYSVPRAFAESNLNLALFCVERLDGMMSCGNQVRYDDYHPNVATNYRSLDEYHLAHAPVRRPLIYDFFDNPQDCYTKWSH